MSRAKAWYLIGRLIQAPIECDPYLSQRAGYRIYKAEDGSATISDLGSRLEINFIDDGKSVNLWLS